MSEGVVSPGPAYPVFVLCGRDPKRRRLMEEVDPDGQYDVKALLPFLGKRVIDWQVEALAASAYVSELYLLGLSEAEAQFDLPLTYVPVARTAGFAEKLLDGLDHIQAHGHVPTQIVISTSDAPGITTACVDVFFRELTRYPGYDFVLGVVPEALAEETFGDPGRAVGRFRDVQVFPGELYALSPRAIRQGHALISQILQRRRRVNRHTGFVGLWPIIWLLVLKRQMWLFVLRYLLGRATLSDAERAFSSAFNCRTKAIVVHDVGFGMDMDLPEDYERLKAYVAGTRVVTSP